MSNIYRKINIWNSNDYRIQGGTETYYYEIMKHYKNREFLFWISTTNIDNTKSVRAELPNVKIEYLFKQVDNKHRKKSNILKTLALWWNFKIMKRRKKEIWLIEFNWARILLLPKKFFKNNDVYIFQHFEMVPPRKLFSFFFLKWQIWSKLNMCKKIHIFCEEDKDIMVKLNSKINIKLFSYNSIFPSSPIGYTLSSKRSIDIIFVGRDVPGKRLDKFINIIQNYQQNNKKITSLIIGKKIKGIDSYANLNRVDLFNALKNSKFLVVASESEGNSLIMIEAMSQDTQIIIYSVSVSFYRYRNVKGIHFVKSIEEINKIIDNWKFLDLQMWLKDNERKYSYFLNNSYLNDR